MAKSTPEGPFPAKKKTGNYPAKLVQVGGSDTEEKPERGDQSKDKHDTQDGWAPG